MFDRLVDLTEPICQRIDADKANMALLDTSGIEAWVTENNPKYANRIIKQLKAFKKVHNLDDSYNPYKAAYGFMPPHAAANAILSCASHAFPHIMILVLPYSVTGFLFYLYPHSLLFLVIDFLIKKNYFFR